MIGCLLAALLLGGCGGGAATVAPTPAAATPPTLPTPIPLTARAVGSPTQPGERPPDPFSRPAETRTPVVSPATPGGLLATVPRSPVATASRTPAGSATPRAITPGTTLAGPELAAALRRGGFIIFFRHAATDFSQTDSDRQNLENCATQRNLSERGRADARQIGAEFRRLGIPVDRVLASAYCRTRETATLAFGGVTVEPSLLSPSSARDDAERVTLRAAFDRLFVTPPPPGTNTVLVGHDFSIGTNPELGLDEGQAGIFLPTGNTRAALVALVLPGEWAALAVTSPERGAFAAIPQPSVTPRREEWER